MTFKELTSRAERRFRQRGLALPRIIYQEEPGLVQVNGVNGERKLVEGCCVADPKGRHAIIHISTFVTQEELERTILHELIHAHSLTIGEWKKWRSHPKEFYDAARVVGIERGAWFEELKERL